MGLQDSLSPARGEEKGLLCSLYLAYRLCLGSVPSPCVNRVAGWFLARSVLVHAVCSKCSGHRGRRSRLNYSHVKPPLKSEPPPPLSCNSHSLWDICLPAGVLDAGFWLFWRPDASALRGSGFSGPTDPSERRKILSETHRRTQALISALFYHAVIRANLSHINFIRRVEIGEH